MIFAGITKSSLLDYPGKISIVLYTPGCNYDCFYCHNRRIIEAFNDSEVAMEEIEELLNKRVGLIDAVVITGGEPTLHNDLIDFLQEIKKLGYLTKLDSNGSNPEFIKKCIEANAVDYYAIDYKAPLERYKEITNSNHDGFNVIETIALLMAAKKDFEVRTTVIPQLNLNDLIQMAQELPRVPRYVLNPYKKPLHYREQDIALIEEPPYPEETIKKYSVELKLFQPNIVLPF
jgi:pyruvate formate lyase activating enzyme